DSLIHEQGILIGRLHQTAQDLLMEEHICVHDNRIIIQHIARDPERRNAAAMELLVDEEIHTHAAGIRRHSRANHLLLIAYNHVGIVNADAPERRKIAMQKGPPSNLDEALRAMLRELP